MLHKWGLRSTSGCDCGYEKQTAIHITDDCNTRRLQGGMQEATQSQNRRSAMVELPGHTNLIEDSRI